jgi:hypothetical protein
VTITLADAIAQLNYTPEDTTELEFYVQAANEWVATRVSDTSPAPVQLATRLLVEHWWDTQRGPVSPNPLDEELGTPYSFGFAIPNRVLELLAPYMNAGVGAKPASATYSFPDAVAYPDPVEWPT